ncbi:MAG: pilus assembly PilX family protein [Gammaproteobacteria bacterium]
MSSQTHRQRRKTETGAVLVVSLVFLLVLTLIGLTGMQVTSLEEKMSGNMRDRNLAFQAAESALRAGEMFVTLPTLPTFSCASGLYSWNDVNCDGTREDAQIWDSSSDWSGSFSRVTYSSGTLASTSPAPAYIIEQMPAVAESGDSLEAGVAKDSQYYRVTARATGGTTDAVVLVQSLYKR